MHKTLSKTTLHVKIDSDLKAKSQALAESLGFPLSVLITATLRNFLRTETLTINNGEQITPYMENWIKEVEQDKLKGVNTSGPFNSIAELKKHLNK